MYLNLQVREKSIPKLKPIIATAMKLITIREPTSLLTDLIVVALGRPSLACAIAAPL